MISLRYTEVCFVEIIACGANQFVFIRELVDVLLPNSSSRSPVKAENDLAAPERHVEISPTNL